MTSENSMYDTEDMLLVLFDAQRRALLNIDALMDDTEPNSEARETALEARREACKAIVTVAVDWVERNEELLEERLEERGGD